MESALVADVVCTGACRGLQLACKHHHSSNIDMHARLSSSMQLSTAVSMTTLPLARLPLTHRVSRVAAFVLLTVTRPRGPPA